MYTLNGNRNMRTYTPNLDEDHIRDFYFPETTPLEDDDYAYLDEIDSLIGTAEDYADDRARNL